MFYFDYYCYFSGITAEINITTNRNTVEVHFLLHLITNTDTSCGVKSMAGVVWKSQLHLNWESRLHPFIAVAVTLESGVP